jgi:uncharacterized repeat protein (TIGR02543 family)
MCNYSTITPVGNVTTYTINNLSGGQTFYFSVTAYDTSNNESGFSNEVSGPATDPTPTQYSLSVNVIGSGAVTKNLDKLTYNQGEQVTLTATPGSGFTFGSWSGDTSGTANPITVAMNGNKTVTANFTQNPIPPTQYTLSVNVNGSGSVTKSPDKPTYNQAEIVTLTATPGPGFAFGDWSGDASGTVNPVTLTMNVNKTVTASFTAVTGNLGVTPSAGLSVSGKQGGPFALSNRFYTLQNSGKVPIQWMVSKKPSWLGISPMNGRLAPGRTVRFTASVSYNAKLLKPGSYDDTIVLSDATHGSDRISILATLAIAPAIKTYTVKTQPEGLQVMVDGVTYATPRAFDWEVGSSHSLDAPSPQMSSLGTQYVFSSWSNRKSRSQTTVASSTVMVYVANFKTQQALTTSVTPPEKGTVMPSGANWPNRQVDMNSYGSTGLLDPESNLPLIGALESPSEGKTLWGLKTIYGWALDGEGISRVTLFIDGKYICDIPHGGLREGLKEAYPGYPNAEKGGFALVWNYSSLPPGGHSIKIDIQNTKGEALNFSLNILVPKIQGEVITQVNPKEWVIPEVNLTLDGNTKTYDLRLEWSNESQAFEIIEIHSP